MRPTLATIRLVHRVNRAAPIACLAALLAGGAFLARQNTGDFVFGMTLLAGMLVLAAVSVLLIGRAFFRAVRT